MPAYNDFKNRTTYDKKQEFFEEVFAKEKIAITIDELFIELDELDLKIDHAMIELINILTEVKYCRNEKLQRINAKMKEINDNEVRRDFCLTLAKEWFS